MESGDERSEGTDGKGGDAEEGHQLLVTEDVPPSVPARRVGLWEIFVIFFKSSLAFGGGLGIVAIMEDELVHRRKLVTREEFLTIYAMGRVTPSGTMTALAVAYGYRFAGYPGTVVALVALVLPSFCLTVALTVAYQYLANGPLLTILPVTVLPAALALILTAALRLGRDLYRPSLDLLFAVTGFAGVLWLGVHPSIMLLLGGVLGVFLMRPKLMRLP